MNETFIQIVSLILGVAFLVLSFRLSRKKEHSLAPVVIIIAAIFLFGGLFHGGGLLKTITLEQCACWIVAIAFLVAAFLYLKKERFSLGFTVFVLAAIFFFCGLSGVQSLLKTGMLWTISERLTKYGEKIDSFQLAMADMRNQLSDQQDQIKTQQQRLNEQESIIRSAQTNVATQQVGVSNQYSVMQGELIAAQTNLDIQAAKIGNVATLVDNLYSNTVTETLSGSDSNCVSIIDISNGHQLVALKMKNIPVPNSIRGIALGNGVQIPLLPFGFSYKNITLTYWDGIDARNTRFSLEYVIDSRDTNLVKNLDVLGNQIFVDGSLLWQAPPTNNVSK